jgi:hypothetical protein
MPVAFSVVFSQAFLRHQHHRPSARDLSQSKSCINTLHTHPSASNHVSRRRHHALRHGLRPRHPRARPRLRIRTVRFLSLAQADRRRPFHRPSASICRRPSPSRAAPAPPLRRAATSLPRHPSRARTARLPSSLFPHDPPVKLSLTTSKLWSPRPLRHPGPALGIQQIVSQHQAVACGRR